MLRAALSIVSILVFTSLAPVARAAPRDASPRAASEACFSAYEDSQSSRRAQHLVKSRSELRACVERCPAILVEDCQRWLREVDVELPRLHVVVEGRPIATAVAIDGVVVAARELELDPGVHEVRVTASGEAPIVRNVSLAVGARLVETFAIAPERPAPVGPPPAPARSIGPPILGGLGAVSLIGAGVLSFVGWQDVGDMRDTCAPAAGGGGCSRDRVDGVHTLWTVAGGLAAFGIVAFGAAVVWRLRFDGGSRTVGIGPGRLSVRW